MRALHAPCTLQGCFPLALMFLVLLSVAQASRQLTGEFQQHNEFTLTVTAQKRRQVLASPFCPEGCSPDGCVQDSTYGGLRCQRCQSNLVVVKSTGVCGELQLLLVPAGIA